MDSIVSENCLYSILGNMTKAEVVRYFAACVEEIEAIICKRTTKYVPNCKYKVNVLPCSSPTIAYMWVTNREIPWMLTGRTHEGSIITDPEDTCVAKGEVNFHGMSAKEQLFAMDWDEIPTTSYEKYVPPNMPGTNSPPVFVRAKADIPGPEYERGTLFCKSPLPQDYKEEYLCSLFAPFNTSRKAIHVTKTGRGNAYIRFPIPTDACFALMLTKKYYDEERNVSLSFDYSIAKEPVKKHYRR